MVRGGSGGGAFSLVLQLLRTCPNRCSGNGRCVRRNTYACVCNPGYSGLDCAKAVPAKLAAWFPFYDDILDRSGNALQLVMRTQPLIDSPVGGVQPLQGGQRHAGPGVLLQPIRV